MDRNGTHPAAAYSIPQEARIILEHGILNNPKIARYLPREVADFASKVSIVGNAAPSIPVSWRFAESATALKAFEACLIATLVKRKYRVDIAGVEVNSDHASLFMMSTLVFTVNAGTEEAFNVGYDGPQLAKLDRLIPNYDFHRHAASPHRINASNIYRTKDGKFFHLHGSLNPDPTLKSVGLPLDSDARTLEEAWPLFFEKLSHFDSKEIEYIAAEVYKQAGCITETIDSFRESEQGKAIARADLFEVHKSEAKSSQPPSWWPDCLQTASDRPLAGLKVVDLTRVIAGPVTARGLAELGASVMRVTSPNIVDYSFLHLEVNWGKWETSLDLKTEVGKATLRELIFEADVVIQGYRPGVLDKYGFSQQDIIDLVRDRPRGIISARENCYGWYGPFMHRTGWQEISDANIGISAAFGKALGLKDDEPVTPIFPNSDSMTGLSGVIAILTALLKRADEGGSYKVDFALNYYNQWLAKSVGEYPKEVWEDLWDRHGRFVYR